jgi:SpoVK/Ycf46/Vps4 family AAA+-type ATPase
MSGPADPALQRALPRALALLAVLADATQPLSDARTMQVWEAVFVANCHRHALENAVTRDCLGAAAPAATTPAGCGAQSDGAAAVARRESLMDSLQNLEDALVERMDARVATMELKPRMVRLTERLGLNKCEVRAWVCIVLSCTGMYAPPDSAQSLMRNSISNWSRSELLTIREFAGFESASELLQFLSPGNPIMKQGLLEVDDEMSTSYSDCRFRAPREVLKAVYGGHITLDEYMTVDGTALADVLKEEPGSVIDSNGMDMSAGNDDYDEDNQAADSVSKDTPGGRSADVTDKVDGLVSGGGRSTIATDARHKHDNMLGLLSELRLDANPSDKTDAIKSDRMTRKKDGHDGTTAVHSGEGLSNSDHVEGILANDIDGAVDDIDDVEVDDLGPYKNDMEYLEDGFSIIQEACKVYNFKEKSSEEDRYQSTKRPVEALQREAEAKQRKAVYRFSRRLSKTRQAGGPLPRLELLVNKLKLDHFERMVILTLVGATLSQPVRKALRADPTTRYDGISVSKLLRIHCNGDLKEEVAARFHFYRRGRLIRSGIISVDTPYGILGDLGECIVDLDHMVLDYVAGLQTEIDELMDSARFYTPKVSMDSVVLPKDMKNLVIRQAESFELFRKVRKAVGLDDIVRYGGGLTMLFHGRSGTGKTMFANALATHLKRKLLVVDFASLNNSKFSGSEAYRIVFREATIHRAIVFFDECDEILESRDRGGKGAVALALREMEVFDGIMILATNRAQMLDEAVHRRISLSVEFAPPDVELRLDIWRKHIPDGLRLSKDVDLGALALEYELSGGLIKNAILQALSSAISRLREEKSITQEQIDQGQDFKEATGLDVGDVIISMSDLRSACRLQARGHLKRIKLERRVLPVSGLDTLITSDKAMEQLRDIVMVEKVRGLMTTRWGFKSRVGRSNCVLLFGPQGCGKTFAAGCIGFETGRPLQTISMSEMGGLRDSGAQIGDIFGEASIAGAVVVVEQAEQLLFEASRPEDTGSPGLELLYHLQTYNGLVILCCTTVLLPSEAGWDVYTPVPNRLTNLLSYVVVLEKPNTDARLRLWRQLFPKSMPREDSLDSKLPEIASTYEFTGARISGCIRRAAAAAAMRANRISLAEPSELASMDSSKAKVSVTDVINSCETELRIRKETGGLQFYDKLYV